MNSTKIKKKFENSVERTKNSAANIVYLTTDYMRKSPKPNVKKANICLKKLQNFKQLHQGSRHLTNKLLKMWPTNGQKKKKKKFTRKRCLTT